MALTEAEELELLELEEEEARLQATSSQSEKGYWGRVGDEIGDAFKDAGREAIETTQRRADDFRAIDQGGAGGPIGRGAARIAGGALSVYQHAGQGIDALARTAFSPITAAFTGKRDGEQKPAGGQKPPLIPGAPGYAPPQFSKMPEWGSEAVPKPVAQYGRYMGERIQNMSPEEKATNKASIGVLSTLPLGRAASGALKQGGKAVLNETLYRTTPTMGEVVSGAAQGAKQAVTAPIRAVGKKADNILGELFETQTAIPENVLRLAGTKEGKAFLKANKGKAYEIGQKFIDDVYHPVGKFPEAKDLPEMLDNLPAMNPNGLINALENAKIANPAPDLKKVNDKLDANIAWIANTAIKNNGKISSKEILNIRKQLDGLIDEAYGKAANDYITGLKDARHATRQALLDAAELSGNTEYAQKMQAINKKLQIIDRLKERLGSERNTGEGRVESFLRNLFNEGKTNVREIMSDFDEAFGTNYLTRANAAKLADYTNKEGDIPLLSKWPTGKAGALGLIGSVTVGSPRLASKVLPFTEKMANLGRPNKPIGALPAIPKRLMPPSGEAVEAAPDILKPMDMQALQSLAKTKEKSPALDYSQDNPFWNLEKATRANDPEALAQANAQANALAGKSEDFFHVPDHANAMDADELANYDQAMMRAAGPEEDIARETAQKLRNEIFPGSVGEISLKSLPAKERQRLTHMAERINTSHDNDYNDWWAGWGSRGYPDVSDLTAEDLVSWMNEKTIGGAVPKGPQGKGPTPLDGPLGFGKKGGPSGIVPFADAGKLPIRGTLARTGLGVSAGAGVGATQGETPEERFNNALRTAVGGGMAAFGAPGLVKMAKSGFKDGPASANAGLYAGKSAKGFDKAEGKFSSLTDREPRFEISDKGTVFDPKILNKFETGESYYGTVGDAFKHPTLFSNYPELRDVLLAIHTDKGITGESASKGSFNPGRKRKKEGYRDILPEITIKATTPAEARRTLIHELQHAIQEKEGFAKGANFNSIFHNMGAESLDDLDRAQILAQNMDDFIKSERKAEINKLYEDEGLTQEALDKRNNTPEMQEYFKNSDELTGILKKYNIPLQRHTIDILKRGEWPIEVKDTFQEKAFGQYQRHAGEIEARDAAARAQFPKSLRDKYQPFKTQEIPLKDMIVKKDGGVPIMGGIAKAKQGKK